MHAHSKPREMGPALAGHAAWARSDVVAGDGVRVAVFEAGTPSGEPLVLLHGIGHWTQAAWDALLPELDAYRVVAIDLPGFGESDRPDAPYDAPYYARIVEDVVEARGLGRFCLAGNSLGGMIAAQFASGHPERVAALVLIAPAGFRRSPGLVVRVFGVAPLLARLRLHPPRRFVRRVMEAATHNTRVLTDDVHDRAYRLSRDPLVARAFGRVYWNHRRVLFDMAALHARFARYRGPVAIVWGRQDRYLPVAGIERARAVYPHATETLLDGCGHLPQVEMPARVGAEIR